MKSALLSFAAAVAIAALPAAAPALAHHSFAATYDEQQTVTIEGNITAFLYRNPHSFVEMETTDDHGVTTKWAAEWFSSGRLGRVGVTADTFKPGDHVILTGAPGRIASEHRLHLKTITRPSDGLKLDRMAARQRGR